MVGLEYGLTISFEVAFIYAIVGVVCVFIHNHFMGGISFWTGVKIAFFWLPVFPMFVLELFIIFFRWITR